MLELPDDERTNGALPVEWAFREETRVEMRHADAARSVATDTRNRPAPQGSAPPGGPFDARRWLAYFAANAAHRPRIPWDAPLSVDARLRDPLVRSLQRFQVGEQGDGRHLRAAAAMTNDPAYSEAIESFVREEQGHSRLLARALARLESPLLARHWSDTCFVLLRRLAGLRLELLVLLVAEIVAQRYYPALRDGVEDAALRAAFARIADDEEGHVAFHCAYLRSTLAPLPPAAHVAIRVGWRLLFRGACLAVMLDHRGVLRGVGVSPAAFWRDCGRLFDQAADRIFAPGEGTGDATT